jgi:hypothetical protein
MTGPEHLREADLILTETDRCEHGCPHSGCVHEMALIARAQVHATLALAAATAGLLASTSVAEHRAWAEVIRKPAAAKEAEQ